MHEDRDIWTSAWHKLRKQKEKINVAFRRLSLSANYNTYNIEPVLRYTNYFLQMIVNDCQSHVSGCSLRILTAFSETALIYKGVGRYPNSEAWRKLPWGNFTKSALLLWSADNFSPTAQFIWSMRSLKQAKRSSGEYCLACGASGLDRQQFAKRNPWFFPCAFNWERLFASTPYVSAFVRLDVSSGCVEIHGTETTSCLSNCPEIESHLLSIS